MEVFKTSRQVLIFPASGTGTAVAIRFVSNEASADLLQKRFNNSRW